ncbi:SRPBCC family protein [Pseudonocardia sp. S2-4]|uniref:SRPBCC family protein n=1 Tax=Pseudonocardia humida TaxID=2800819 RepID=A0ABT1A4X9_9PSEU|nr:SRPBCC family protein [Pseudonocardia humida]
MAVRRETAADAEAVWRVLADGWLYPSWVVGASRMRDVDEGWPAVGTMLHHSVGAWPALINDTTSVTGCVPGRELMLRGRLWPLGEADIRLRLEPNGDAGGGCTITMEEDVASGPTKLLPKPVRTAMIVPRNVEALRRLIYLAEGRSR